MIYSWVENWEAMAFIYVITNDINGKQYVGKTNNSIEERFREHISDSRRRRCEKRPLYSAMNKYGIEHFHISVLEECSADDACAREIYWIDKLQTYGHTGYNATKGGDSKKYYDYKIIAKKYTELLNEKETALYFGCTVDTVRAACEELDIPILSSSEVSKHKYGKAIAMLDKDTKQVIKIFNCIRDAARYLADSGQAKSANGINTHISRAARHKGRNTAYGYIWYFIND